MRLLPRHPALRPRCRSLALWVAGGLLGLASSTTLAQSEGTGEWDISGFGTLGLVSQHGAEGWRMSRNLTQRAADGPVSVQPDTRMGTQINWRSGSHWEAALQVVALPKPPGSPLRDSVEWAYLGYRPLPDTRLRLGRTNPDTFLYADSRNVGYALPWVRPPVDFYGFAPVAAVDGLDMEQQWTNTDTRWRVRMTIGSFASTIEQEGDASFRVGAKEVIAAGLLREEGGLLLKASMLKARLHLGMPPQFLQLKQGIAGLQALPVPGLADAIAPIQDALWMDGRATYLALGAQYDTGPWSSVTEVSDLRIPKTQTGGRRTYASLSYRQGPVSYYALASRVRPHERMLVVPDVSSPLTPLLGPLAALQAQGMLALGAEAGARSRFDQRTIGLGVRWDATPNMALKVQIDRFKVYPNGAAAWMDRDASPKTGNLLSMGLDFVWGQ